MIALEVFGRELPTPSIGVVAVVVFALFFLANRSGGVADASGGGRQGRAGRGRMYQCTRCGRNFQPEQVEVLGNGQVNVFHDDRCPNCGWDLDWGNADKQRPGGASRGW